jgi:formylglycine-generating enzyme required for sulfatase activity
MPLFGAHMSIAGGFHQAALDAHARGSDTLQVVTKAPSQWYGRDLTADEVRLFRRTLRETKLRCPVAHDSYLINLASPDGVREPLLQKLLDDYQNHPDAGVHGSTDWLLRQWGRLQETRAIDERLRGKPPEKRQWYVNGQGQTYSILAEGDPFYMGSPENDADRRPDEDRHLRKIPRSFAVAAKEVTRAQFERFLDANPDIKEAFNENGEAAPLLERYSPEAETPTVLVNWYLAAQYCNWLSKEEGIEEGQWCYPSDPKKITVGLVLAPECLEKTGYRLPTEAEWECVCRAGAETSRAYGGGDEVLGAYAWYLKTSPDRCQVVGRLRPNDWGLFDMHGNVWQWCHNPYVNPYPTKEAGPTSVIMDMKGTLIGRSRVLRGGSFNDDASTVRSAYRVNTAPANRILNFGFRPARTFR